MVHTGDYSGSPLGCDANAGANGLDQMSVSVTAADLICTVLRFFRHECSSVEAARTTTARLALAPIVTNGMQNIVPLTLETGGQAVAGVAFALTVDATGFDPRDGDGDGLPDAVTLTIPATMNRAVTWNANAHRIEVAIYGASLPLPTVADGVLATVRISAASTTPPALTLVSLSDANGNDLLTAPRADLFLPLIVR